MLSLSSPRILIGTFNSKGRKEEDGRSTQRGIFLWLDFISFTPSHGALNLLLFDNASAVQQKAAHVCFLEALAPTETHQHSGYETNLNLVRVARHLDFNGHLHARFVARSKDTVNPNGILGPGKPGIWPKKYRALRKQVEENDKYLRLGSPKL